MVRPTRLLAALVACGVLLGACGDDGDGGSGAAAGGGAAVSGEVSVFAAASLTEAFTAIGDAFETANPDADVTFNFAGSSALVQQIVEGAPADVFASADESNMAKLTDAGGAAADPAAFATNSMEIVVEPGNPKGITGPAGLAGPGVKVVLCAPEVPCGKLAGRVLADAGVTVTPVSLEENVKAVLTKVELGEADAGIVYRTDVLAAGAAVEGVAIPADQDAVTTLVLAPTTEARNEKAAGAFVAFVLGPEGRAILERYGFGPP